MWPLGSLVEELKGVIVEFGSKGQPAWKVACTEEDKRLWPRDLVDIRNEEDVALDSSLATLQLGNYLIVHGVAL